MVSVPKILREKLGEDGAQALVELINEANGYTKTETLTFVEQKFERRLTEEAAKINERIGTEVAKVNERIGVLEVRIAETKADLMRWMFIFWGGQIGALTAILFAFFRA